MKNEATREAGKYNKITAKIKENKLRSAGILVSNAIHALDEVGMTDTVERLCEAYGEIREEQDAPVGSKVCKMRLEAKPQVIPQWNIISARQ